MLYYNQKEREKEVTKMTELEMTVKMLDRKEVSFKMEESREGYTTIELPGGSVMWFWDATGELVDVL